MKKIGNVVESIAHSQTKNKTNSRDKWRTASRLCIGEGFVSAQRGITLIALIVTIIIILILAGVTISVMFGENGIFKTAKQATESYKIAGIKERVEQAILVQDMEKMTKGEKLTVEQALVSLHEHGIFEEIDLKEQTGICEGYVIKLGCNENGKVVILEMDKDGGIRIEVALTPKGYTNGKIEANIAVKSNGAKVTNLEIPTGMTLKQDNIYEIEKNGTYIVRATLDNGEKLEKEIKIATIDTESPKAFTPNVETIDGGFIINAKAEDADATDESVQSGIDYYEYYVNDEKKESNEITGLANGTYTVYVIAYDKAGNHIKSEEKEIKITIKIAKISTRGSNNLAIDIKGNLWAWGYNGEGQLGDGTTTSSKIPVQIKPGTKFKEISAGGSHSLAIDVDGNLWAWGNNNQGQFIDETTAIITTPVQIKPETKFKEISAGRYHNLAIDADGLLWAWGNNQYGKLGNGTEKSSKIPVQIKEDTTFDKITTGEYHTLAIDVDGNVWAWGYNGYGQLGDGTTTSSKIPVQIKPGTKFKEISALRFHSLAIDVGGNLWAWGDNRKSQLGDGTNTSRTSPVQIQYGTQFKKVSTGESHCLAIDVDGNVWAWGDNGDGQLGNGTKGTKTSSKIPVQIKAGTQFKEVSAGYYHSIALDVDGNVWAWGDNGHGQLGDGTYTSRTSPVQIF